MILKELLALSEKKLSDVKAKKHPPEGLFKSGSAQKIANWALSSHNGNHAKAMSSLSFYLNRAGSVPEDQRDRVEKAKAILRSKKSKLSEDTDVIDKKINKTQGVEKELPLNDPSGWNVMIMNNHVTPAEVVVEAIVAAVKISPGEAMKRMMAAHQKGWVAVAAYGSKDMADTVASKIEMHAHQNKSYDHYRQFVKHTGPWPLDTEVMKAGE